MAKILVVDDEPGIRLNLEAVLREFGHSVEAVDSGEKAIAVMRRVQPDIVISDVRMDGMSGVELLGKTREYFPGTTVVLMTAYASVDSAVNAMKMGAYDYLVKPFTPEQVEHLLRRIEEFRRLKDENLRLKDQVDLLSDPSTITSENPKMVKLLETAKKVAVTDSSILITGESGTGKTLLAKVVHDGSPRAKGPFAVVNCATLSENLLESELFGHVRGSFTGAVKDKIGRLQAADSGTVFLDEIGEISPSLQTKLLRFLQDREFERVGDTKTIKVDVRIVAATNKDLEREVKEGRFREDLYFRLNVIEFCMPSLRQRREDLPALAEQLLTRAFVASNRPARPLSEEARQVILHYPWPGNIRELKNALERAAILCTGTQVEVQDLPDRILDRLGIQEASVESLENTRTEGLPPMGLTREAPVMGQSSMSLDDLERIHIDRILRETRTLEEAAAILGINLSTLWRKRRRYGLE
jgi:NtrC-family two-component system response regulator AlgB